MREQDWVDILLGSILTFLVLWYRRIFLLFAILRMVRRIASLFKKRERGFVMSVQGITSLKSIILVAASLGSIGGEVLSDGKVDLKDLALLPKLFSVFPSLLAVQWDMAIPEAKDLDLAEANELVEYFKTSFDIPQDDLEVKIENVLSVCVKVSSLISELVAIFKKPAV